MEVLKQVFIVLVCTATVGVLTAQDSHFSQFHRNSIYLNPAMTGLLERDMRVDLHHRSEWGPGGSTWQRNLISADLSTLKNILEKDRLGVGLMVMQGEAGTSALRQSEAKLSMAYSKTLDDKGKQMISFGGQLGFVSNKLDRNRLAFENQFNGEYFDLTSDARENTLQYAHNYWDMSAGIAWSYTKGRLNYYQLGISLAHFNQPVSSFQQSLDETLDHKLQWSSSASFQVSQKWAIQPAFLYRRQSNLNQWVLETLFYHDLDREGKLLKAVYVGTQHQWLSNQVLLFGMNLEQLQFSFSYDLPLGPWANVSKGALEFNVRYHVKFLGKTERSKPVVHPFED